MLKILKKSSGIAIFEILPLLVVFISLIGLTLGLWGAVHTGILQSIAARHYAFEVINNRTNFSHHRDGAPSFSKSRMIQNAQVASESDFHDPSLHGMRLFGIVALQEGETPSAYVASRGLNFFKDLKRQDEEEIKAGTFGPIKDTDTPSFHSRLFDENITTQRVNPIWLMQGYGICLNALCGD